MVFVADALGTWLVEQLADAGRKKLTELILGSEQERALRRAADAAVWATAEEMNPPGGEQAGQVAMVISEVFRDPAPDASLAGPVMLLEGLQAGITRQLTVLDDAGLTGTGQSSADVLGVPGTVLADRLTGHLVREIIVRGSGGGPLTPLADQLNHELTRLQIGGMLARLAGEVRDALAQPGSDVTVAGRPLEEVTDPFALEVHRPVQPEDAPPGLPLLPPYVRREHDEVLGQVVSAAADGRSGIAVLVGGASTGKTRACWQALGLLRDQDPSWRLWHPIDPQGALSELPGVEPRTVVWLNEAQRYLDTANGTGERVAARLRELLRERDRGPVLVLATLWPDHWAQLTVRPLGSADPHAQARELLAGHDIPVPGAFTDEQLRQLEGVGDPRLAQAAAGSRDGQVIQYLAGAPELLDRYRTASPAARALIDAAMDAARLGMRGALPRAFLEEAAPGYLTDTDWNLLDDEWLEQALTDTAKPSKGVRGPLAPIRPRPAPGVPASPGSGTAWQLADYLDQQGRRTRRELFPPASFWAAATSYANPVDLTTLAEAAKDRGLYRDAARLYKQASAHGRAVAGADLVNLLHTLHPNDQRPADWAAAHASLDDPAGVAWLLAALQGAGATGQVTTLLDRDPAAHARLDDPVGLALLRTNLRMAGAVGQVTTLLDRHAAYVRLDDSAGVAWLLMALRMAGATGQITTLLDRDPAAHARLDNSADVAMLLRELREVGAAGQVTTLARRAAAHVSPDDPADVAMLLRALNEAGAAGQVTRLARRAAAQVSPDDPADVAMLLAALLNAGATGQVTTLLDRDPAAHVSLDDAYAVAYFLGMLRTVGATGQITTLLDRDPAAHVGLDDSGRVAILLHELHTGVGATGQVTTLATRAAAHVSLDDPSGVAALLNVLLNAGATGQVTTLLDRDPAAHVSLDDPGGVAALLNVLLNAGAAGQVTALLDRDPAAHAHLDREDYVARLLKTLQEAEARAQAAELIERLPAAGRFQLFCKQKGREGQFQYGREADGRPAKRWAWTDLG